VFIEMAGVWIEFAYKDFSFVVEGLCG